MKRLISLLVLGMLGTCLCTSAFAQTRVAGLVITNSTGTTTVSQTGDGLTMNNHLTLIYPGQSTNKVKLTPPNSGGDLTFTFPTSSGTLLTNGSSNTFSNTQIFPVTVAQGDALISSINGGSGSIKIESGLVDLSDYLTGNQVSTAIGSAIAGLPSSGDFTTLSGQVNAFDGRITTLEGTVGGHTTSINLIGNATALLQSQYTALSGSLSNYATMNWVLGQGYVTSIDLGMMLSSTLPTAISMYMSTALPSYLSMNGYVTSTGLSTYLSTNGYLTSMQVYSLLSSSLPSMLASAGYITSTDLSMYLSSNGYITSSQLSTSLSMYLSTAGYVTQNDLSMGGYWNSMNANTNLTTALTSMLPSYLANYVSTSSFNSYVDSYLGAGSASGNAVISSINSGTGEINGPRINTNSTLGVSGNDLTLATLSPNPTGTFTNATVTIDQYGRVTSASSASSSGGVTYSSATVSTTGNSSITQSELASANVLILTRGSNNSGTIPLGNGTYTGQKVTLVYTNSNGHTITINDSGNVAMPSNRTLTNLDLLELVWMGSSWVEVGYSDNQ